MHSSTFFKTVSLLATISSVAAHGFITGATLGGKTYQGASSFNSDDPAEATSPIRHIIDDSGGPAAGDLDTANMGCGVNARPAPVTADVTAGSEVSIQWSTSWPHELGPIMTYLGKCDGDCSSVSYDDVASIDFFKIDQAGYTDNGAGDVWVQEAVIKAGQPYTFNLPTDIPDGQYLMRHEILALHRATEVGGAEFYPGCIQINVSGGSASSIPSSTVKFPGAYSADDPGVLVPTIFNGKVSDYVFPGGPVVVGGADTGSGGGDSESSAVATQSSTAADGAVTSAAAATSKGASSTVTVTATVTVTSGTRAATSAAATATSSTGNGGSGFALENGKDAIALNEEFASLTADSSCNDGDIGCVGGGFGQCVGGKYVVQQCSGGLQCFALPLVNTAGTTVTCTTEDDKNARIAATGATASRRLGRRHRRVRLSSKH